MSRKKETYTTGDLQKDFIAGSGRGLMLGFCWGTVMGPFMKYDQTLPLRTFAKNWSWFVFKSSATFMPIMGASSVVYEFCEAAGLGTVGSTIFTIGVAGILFNKGRNFIS